MLHEKTEQCMLNFSIEEYNVDYSRCSCVTMGRSMALQLKQELKPSLDTENCQVSFS